MAHFEITRENMAGKIQAAINSSVEQAKEEFVKKAVAEFEKEVRKRIATSAVSLSEYYSMMDLRHELVITVKKENRP